MDKEKTLNSVHEALVKADMYDKLKKAVSDLYMAAFWTADRPVEAEKLWKAVKDAACLGHGPTKIENPWKLKIPPNPARCICNAPLWIVIPPGSYYTLHCPVHGDIKIYSSSPYWYNDQKWTYTTDTK